MDFEKYIIDIVEQSSRALGGTLNVSSIRRIGRPDGKDRVKDAGLAFYIDGNRRVDDAVLLVANPRFGQTVAMDVECAREVAMQVDQEVGRHIARPIYEGQFGSQTYAVFSRLSPYSDNRFIRFLQKPAAVSRVAPWLSSLAEQTKQTKHDPLEYDRLFINPLVNLSQDANISEDIREFAQNISISVQRERPELITVIQHGDFWVGNVFFERRILENLNPTLGDFSVIDWRGMRLDGYPCMDLVRFCLSVCRVGASSNDTIMREYGESLCISRYEMSVYCLLALGRLGAELDHFPKERYCSMCDTVFNFLQRHVWKG